MNNLKISVVTVCYNAVNTIEDTILSVLNQTYDNIEYIIIDGGSTDGTVSIIKKYSNLVAYWVSEKDGGIFDAMNKGICIASGNYINFMNAGDTFINNNVVCNTVKKIKNNKSSVYYGDVIFDNNGKQYMPKMTPFFFSKKKIKPMGICHQSMFIRIDDAEKYKFDCSYKLTADYKMAMCISKAGGHFESLGFPVAKFNIEGISSKNWKKRMLEEALINGFKENNLSVQLLIHKTTYRLILGKFIKKIIRFKNN